MLPRLGSIRGDSSLLDSPLLADSNTDLRQVTQGRTNPSLGSSPPARGTPPPEYGLEPCGRFIPARAGNTGYRSWPACSNTVHPRPRGEHLDRDGRGECQGRFIPARGGEHCATARSSPGAFRFIPARAGNTSPPDSRSHTTPVHPRPRGEHGTIKTVPVPSCGSSPPARGTLVELVRHELVVRFIPARAGNTVRKLPPHLLLPVHPRPRGEHRFRRCSMASLCRFIPARAGNTAPGRRASTWSPVHPRPRGEHTPAVSDAGRNSGSSPPARGTHDS